MTGRVPTVIIGTNADLMVACRQLGYLGDPDDVVVDVTYGRGAWWRKYRPPRLIAHDLALDGVDFRQLPEADGSITVVCYDPPYTPTGNRATSSIDEHYDRYGLGETHGWAELWTLCEAGLKECARVLAPGGHLLVKSADGVESGRRRFLHHRLFAVALEVGLEPVDELILVRRRPGPQPPGRGQEHAHQAHSYLQVFTQP
jgi:hypothetical protein